MVQCITRWVLYIPKMASSQYIHSYTFMVTRLPLLHVTPGIQTLILFSWRNFSRCWLPIILLYLCTIRLIKSCRRALQSCNIAAIIPGTGEEDVDHNRVIVLYYKHGGLCNINHLHPHYAPSQRWLRLAQIYSHINLSLFSHVTEMWSWCSSPVFSPSWYWTKLDKQWAQTSWVGNKGELLWLWAPDTSLPLCY